MQTRSNTSSNNTSQAPHFHWPHRKLRTYSEPLHWGCLWPSAVPQTPLTLERRSSTTGRGYRSRRIKHTQIITGCKQEPAQGAQSVSSPLLLHRLKNLSSKACLSTQRTHQHLLSSTHPARTASEALPPFLKQHFSALTCICIIR